MSERGEIVNGRRGGADLLLDGYRYNKRPENKNGTTLWHCRLTGCTATLTTDSEGTVVRRGTGHTHSADEANNKVCMLVNSMRNRARDELTSVPEIYEQERAKLLTDVSPADVAANLKLYDGLRTNLYRERAKKVPRTPLNSSDFELAVHNVARALLSSTELKACLLWRKLQDLGLSSLYRTSEEICRWFRMFTGLAFLPVPHVVEGFELTSYCLQFYRINRQMFACSNYLGNQAIVSDRQLANIIDKLLSPVLQNKQTDDCLL